MSHAPRVSIVMPVFNDEATVSAAVESCLAQTMSEIEVICVDDASTDGTTAVIEDYARRDPRVRCIRQTENRTAFQARRMGVLAATAEHVLFLDGDDELLPDAAAKALAASDGVDLVGFAIEVVGLDGGIVGGYQKRLAPQHAELSGSEVLSGLFPIDKPAQGQLWRYLFRTALLRDAYALVPEDLALPRVNDLPLLFLVAALAERYASVPDRLYRYHYGRGGSGQTVDTIERAEFYAEAIRSIDSIAPAVRSIARSRSNPGGLLDAYESVRLSLIGYVSAYLLKHASPDLVEPVLRHLHTCATGEELVLAAVRFYPETLGALKRHSATLDAAPSAGPVQSVLLTTRKLTTGGVSAVLLAQADLLMRAGYSVTIVARRHGSDDSAVPGGATFIEMTGRGLAERLAEWADICRSHAVDVIIDHQILYSRDWPEYALVARTVGARTIGWIHNFVGRPLYDRNGLHAVLTENAPLLETMVSLSPLDVAFWKLRGVPHAVWIPNPPSPMLAESVATAQVKTRSDERIRLIWWGRLDEHTKQMTQLIDVADRLRERRVDFELTVIGPDWGEWTTKRFNDLVAARRLQQQVRAVGERRGQELLDAIDSADALVTTSVIEGYQLTIAEAQSRGLPVFMYELPWLTLVQQNAGVVTAPQGDAATLAAEIVDAFASPERYAALSEASVEAARRALSYDFASLYQQVITGTLPPEYSPEPTMADATQLLDLAVFYAERGSDDRSAPAASGGRVRAGAASKERASTADGSRISAIGQRAWGKARPAGRILLQLFPGLRPVAHRAKLRLARRRG